MDGENEGGRVQGNLLMVGHANGDVALWELKKQGWDLAKTIKGAKNCTTSGTQTSPPSAVFTFWGPVGSLQPRRAGWQRLRKYTRFERVPRDWAGYCGKRLRSLELGPINWAELRQQFYFKAINFFANRENLKRKKTLLFYRASCSQHVQQGRQAARKGLTTF